MFELLGITFTGLDVVIIAVVFLYVIEGYEVGFVTAFSDLLNFIIAFVVGLKIYSFLGALLVETLAVPTGFANAAGFFIAALFVELLLAVVIKKPFSKVYNLFHKKDPQELEQSMPVAYLDSFNHLFGIVPGFLSAFILLAFLLTTIISLPFSPFLKNAVSGSQLATSFVARTQSIEKKFNDILGGAINDTLTFVTIDPSSNKMVKLGFSTTNVTIDEKSEQEMFVMINSQRQKAGSGPVAFDTQLSDVARAHAKDMFAQGYFSHYSPTGQSPFERMIQAHVEYNAAGENLALAPNVSLAMQGLMESKGHRANILSTQFGKVGVGVIDAGIYGKMFVQEFTD